MICKWRVLILLFMFAQKIIVFINVQLFNGKNGQLNNYLIRIEHKCCDFLCILL